MNTIIGIIKDEQDTTIGYKVYLEKEKRSMLLNTRTLTSFMSEGRLPLVNAELDKAKHLVLYGAEAKYPSFTMGGDYIQGSALGHTIMGIDELGRYKVVTPWGVMSPITTESVIAIAQTKGITNAKLVPKGDTVSITPLKGTFQKDKPPVEYKHLFIDTPNAFGYCPKWRVQVIETGQPYGRTYALINDKKPLVEFYDMVHNQFVASYYVETILDRSRGQGLNLQMDVHSWSIDGAYMDKIMDWLRKQV